jgi:hypothetical protein
MLLLLRDIMLAENFQIADQYMHRIFLNAQEENRFTRLRREIRYKRIKPIILKAKQNKVLLKIIAFLLQR